MESHFLERLQNAELGAKSHTFKPSTLPGHVSHIVSHIVCHVQHPLCVKLPSTPYTPTQGSNPLPAVSAWGIPAHAHGQVTGRPGA